MKKLIKTFLTTIFTLAIICSTTSVSSNLTYTDDTNENYIIPLDDNELWWGNIS